MLYANLTAARTAYAYRVAAYYAAPTRLGLVARVAAGARYNLARAAYRRRATRLARAARLRADLGPVAYRRRALRVAGTALSLAKRAYLAAPTPAARATRRAALLAYGAALRAYRYGLAAAAAVPPGRNLDYPRYARVAARGRAALTAALGPVTVAPGSNAAYATYAAGLRRSLPPALTRPPGYGA